LLTFTHSSLRLLYISYTMLSSQAISTQRAPSPHRPSFSSSRSRLSKDDFENALLNPNQTVFLSGSPGVGENETPPRIRGSIDTPAGKRSFEEDMRDTPQRSHPAVGIVPPTPSTIDSHSQSHGRRPSQATMESDGTPTKARAKGPSVGLDGE
jgi:hypothetical protein